MPDDHFAVYKAVTSFSEVDRYKAFNKFRIPLNSRPPRNRTRICTPRQFREKVAGKLTRQNSGLVKGIGIPQGSPLSPLLSNMYMANFDLAMQKWAESVGGMYWRYCDDILVVAPRKSTAIIDRTGQVTVSGTVEAEHQEDSLLFPWINIVKSAAAISWVHVRWERRYGAFVFYPSVPPQAESGSATVSISQATRVGCFLFKCTI